MIARLGDEKPGAPGCLPNSRQRLLLQAACDSEEIARHAWLRWREQNDLISPDAASVRLLPWIYHRREQLRLPSPEIAALEGVYRYAWFMNQRLLNGAAQVVRTLRAEGIDVLLLKGLPILIEAYRDEGGRYMEDFDLMVRPEDLERVVEKLGTLGWAAQAPEDFSHKARKWRHSSDFLHSDGLSCDLHWRLLRHPNEPVDESPLWAGKRAITIRGEQAFMPATHQMLVHLFVHGMSWERVPPVRWILDVHLLLRHQPPDWRAVLSEAQRREVMLPVSEALAVYNDLLPDEIPREVREQAARFRPNRKQRLAHELATCSYEQASWRVVWQVYRMDWAQAKDQGRVRPGFPGALAHLRLYWKVDSVTRLPWQFARRLCSKAWRAIRRLAA